MPYPLVQYWSRTKAHLQRLWRRWRLEVGLTDRQANGTARKTESWVPIRSLSSRHKPRIERHLCGLTAQDRYLRFGYAATAEQIELIKEVALLIKNLFDTAIAHLMD